jgi:hypothetical protein
LARLRTVWFSLVSTLALLATPVLAFDRIVIDAEMKPDAKIVAGTVEVSYATLDGSLHDVHFRLYWNSFCREKAGGSGDTAGNGACGTQVNAVWVNGERLPAPYRIDGTDLIVPAPASAAAQREVIVKVEFTGYIPAEGRRFGFKKGRCFLYGWFPMPAPVRDGQWLNLRYEEFTELAADCYDISGVFRVPDSIQIFGSGFERIETNSRTREVHFDLPASHDFALFTATGFRSDTSQIDGIRVIINYRDQGQFALDTLKETIRQTLEYMGKKVHPYPFDEFNVLVGGLAEAGGLELPRLILLEEPRDPFSPELFRLLVIHETIHQWFYGILNSNQALDPWMDEAVTMYFTGLISADITHGRPDRFYFWGLDVRFPELRRLMARPYIDLVPVNLPVNDYHDPLEYFTAVYDKGYMVMNTLFGLLSDSDRDEFFKEYYRLYQFKSPTPDNLLSLLSQFQPYRGNKGAWRVLETTDRVDFQVSKLTIEEVTAADLKSIDSVKTRANEYRSSVTCTARHSLGLPTELRIEFYDGTTRDTTFVLNSGEKTLGFTGPSPARGAVIDPDYKYAIDVNLLNNSYVDGGSVGAGLRLSSGLTFLIQSLLSSIWGM